MTTIIIIIIASFFFTEFLTYTCWNTDSKLSRIYLTIIRTLTVALAITTICVAMRTSTVEDELYIKHSNHLHDLQATMIDNLANHASEIHGCDLPCFDGDLLDSIHRGEELLDSLYEVKH